MLLPHAGVEGHLQQDVTELLDHVGDHPGLDRLGRFVGLLDEIGDEREVGLLGVPRTATRGAEAVHHRHEVEHPRPGRVPRPDDDLHLRRRGEARDLGGDGVTEPRVAVDRADPHDLPQLEGALDEGTGSGRGRLVGDRDDVDPRRPHRLDLRVVVTSEDEGGRLQGRPGVAGEDPRRHPGRRDEEGEPGAGGSGGAELGCGVAHAGVRGPRARVPPWRRA